MTRSSGRRRRTTRLARLVVPVPAERFAACSTATTSTAGSWVGQGSFVVANGALQAAPAGTWDCCGIPARPRPTSSCAANGDSPRPTTTPRCCERHSLVWTPGLPRRLGGATSSPPNPEAAARARPCYAASVQRGHGCGASSARAKQSLAKQHDLPAAASLFLQPESTSARSHSFARRPPTARFYANSRPRAATRCDAGRQIRRTPSPLHP